MWSVYLWNEIPPEGVLILRNSRRHVCKIHRFEVKTYCIFLWWGSCMIYGRCFYLVPTCSCSDVYFCEVICCVKTAVLLRRYIVVIIHIYETGRHRYICNYLNNSMKVVCHAVKVMDVTNVWHHLSQIGFAAMATAAAEIGGRRLINKQFGASSWWRNYTKRPSLRYGSHKIVIGGNQGARSLNPAIAYVIDRDRCHYIVELWSGCSGEFRFLKWSGVGSSVEI